MSARSRSSSALVAAIVLIPLAAFLPGCGGSNDNSGNNFGSKSDFGRSNGGSQTKKEPTKEWEKNGMKLMQAHNQFGFGLLGQLWAHDNNQNVMVSPFSISQALWMTMNGAGGSTLAEMAKATSLGEMKLDAVNPMAKEARELLTSADPKVILTAANSIWTKQGVTFEPSFLKANEAYYGAGTESIDFASPEAVKQINAWVKQATNEKIDSIVDKIPDTAVMYLMNAVYFKGMWKLKFEKEHTRPLDFHLADGSKKEVPMMNSHGDYAYVKSDGYQAVRLPYGEGRFSMTIVLPDKDMDTFLKDFNSAAWDALSSSMPQSKGDVAIPKFKMAYETSLNDPLKALGMKQAFAPEQADFSKMRKEKDLFVSRVIHKTFIEVNEEGTEAAAATGVEVGVTSAPQTFNFVANRPFLFVIADSTTKAVLFAGVLADPTQG